MLVGAFFMCAFMFANAGILGGSGTVLAMN